MAKINSRKRYSEVERILIQDSQLNSRTLSRVLGRSKGAIDTQRYLMKNGNVTKTTPLVSEKKETSKTVKKLYFKGTEKEAVKSISEQIQKETIQKIVLGNVVIDFTKKTMTVTF